MLSFFKKGVTIQGGTFYKGGDYLRKYGIWFIYKFSLSMINKVKSLGVEVESLH